MSCFILCKVTSVTLCSQIKCVIRSVMLCWMHTWVKTPTLKWPVVSFLSYDIDVYHISLIGHVYSQTGGLTVVDGNEFTILLFAPAENVSFFCKDTTVTRTFYWLRLPQKNWFQRQRPWPSYCSVKIHFVYFVISLWGNLLYDLSISKKHGYSLSTSNKHSVYSNILIDLCKTSSCMFS